MRKSGPVPNQEEPDAAQHVTARLRVLRDDHPDATVSTDLTRLDEIQAVVRAEIVLAAGGSASAYGAAAASLPHAVEEAENRALNRALVALGYVALERPPRDEQLQADAPTEIEPEQHPPDERSSGTAKDEPVHTEPHMPDAPSAPVEGQNGVDAEPPLEDYSWTAFWKWAREHGYQNKAAVEELIEQSITSLSPAQVRNALRAKMGVD
jgi:hypothetical protein